MSSIVESESLDHNDIDSSDNNDYDDGITSSDLFIKSMSTQVRKRFGK